MLCLQFSIDSNFYGFEVGQIIEIVPKVPLRKILGAPDYIAGNFNYRSHLVPVVDLTMLTVKRETENILSSRIAIVRYMEKHYLGLLIENATEILNINTDDERLQPSGIKTDIPYMEKISTENKEMFQFINIEKILGEEVRKIIFPEIEEKAP